MAQTKRLPDAELEVMQTIWTLTPPVTAAEVQQHASSDWKMTSVLTFLSRLTDKGFLSCTKEGRQNLYTPLVSEEDYRQRESVGFIRRLCGGSVKKSRGEPVGRRCAERTGHRRAACLSGRAGAVRRGILCGFRICRL